MGDAPLGLAPSGFEGGPDPLSDIIGSLGVGNKRKNQGDNFHPQKKAKAGLLGSAPVGFEILDQRYYVLSVLFASSSQNLIYFSVE